MPKTIAIGISDLHLSLQKPACRADKDWMEVQAGYLKQVRDFAHERNVPVLCAGDVFDKWNPSPELINFALNHLPPQMICVPGQHDLPEHRIESIHRSGYGVLVNSGKILNVDHSWFSKGFTVFGAGWGQKIKSPDDPTNKGIKIALVHRYVWTEKRSYPGALASAHIDALQKEARGYDVILTGDNHIPFSCHYLGGPTIFNPGTFIRRKSDEINHRPNVAVIYDDGSVKPHLLDTSGDRFHENVKDRPEVPINMREFINQLESLGEHGLNFREEVKRYLDSNDVDEGTRQIILQTIQ